MRKSGGLSTLNYQLSSRSWVKAVMHRLEPLLINVRVYLRGRDVGVAEHFLDDAEIGAVAEQVRGKAMPATNADRR